MSVHIRLAMIRRRKQRSEVVKKLVAQFFEPCPWCKMHRPGQEPNMVSVKIQGSHGICPECLEKAKEAFFKSVNKKKE